MWKYVSRRVKDTIELGINARKAFSLNQLNCDEQQQQKKQQQHYDDKCYKIVLRQQDPSSRDQHRRDEKFKRRYHRLTQNQKCFLSALTWSAALVSGFYTSQLLFLYRRNRRFAVEGSRCFYSKYLLNTTQSVQQNIKYLLTPPGQRSLAESVTKFATTCPFRSASADIVKPSSSVDSSILKRQAIENEIKNFQFFIDPEYKRYARFFDGSDASEKPYNLSNDKPSSEYKEKSDVKKSQKQENLQKSASKSQDEAIDDAVKQLADIVGELEFQLGVESYHAEDFLNAAAHFQLSTNYKHPGGIFNLATCYEKGLGVKKNLKTAKQLYEIASGLGHAKAMYNLGVFHAQGLGGTTRDFHQAKKYFSEAAKHGNRDAGEAMKLLLPKPIILPVIEEYDELFFNNNSSKMSAIENNHKIMRIAVT